MVDLSDKGSDSEEMSSKTPEMVSAQETLNQAKTCVDCGTTKTPLWRGGPAGPKSLCNACGIRSRKRRRALLGLNKDDKKSKKNTAVTVNSMSNSNNNNSHSEASSSTSNNGGNGDNKMGDAFKRKLVALGNEVMVQRPRSTMTKQRRKLGEEEQAAMVLMYLSGSVFAY